jgi:hypothetical protein
VTWLAGHSAGLAVLLLAIRSTVATVIAPVALGRCSAPMTAWAQNLRMADPLAQPGNMDSSTLEPKET